MKITYQHTNTKGVKSALLDVTAQRRRKVLPSNPATWKELHTFKPHPTLKQNQAWMAYFTSRIASHGCKCRADWHTLLHAQPPDYTSPTAWFSWTVAAHNKVNQRLGKPQLTLDQARKIWT